MFVVIHNVCGSPDTVVLGIFSTEEKAEKRVDEYLAGNLEYDEDGEKVGWVPEDEIVIVSAEPDESVFLSLN